MDPYTVIRRPVVSEKTHRIMSDAADKAGEVRLNQYTFEVDPRATKSQIKAAVQQLFDVKVTAVNTMNVSGKMKRVGFGPIGRSRRWKKAIVTLDQDSSIQMY
jgi:large subunit ribosomal protein L23